MIEPAEVKRKSEAAIIAASGKICDWLPTIDTDDLAVRDSRSVAERALILNTLVNLSFGAPKDSVLKWLESNALDHALSPNERAIVEKSGSLTESERNQLRWNIESLWSVAWVVGFIDDLSPTQSISDKLAGFFPSLRAQDPAAPFFAMVRVRTIEQLFEKLDLFYRAHWYARDCRLNGLDDASFNEDVMQFRRIPLEWVLHETVGWDEVDVST